MHNSNRDEFKGRFSAAGSIFEYQYRTLSVNHLAELQEDIDRLDREGQLSQAETFQGYLSEMKFALPEDFPDAQSVIIMAIILKPMMFNLHYMDTRISAAMPPNYYESGLTRKMLLEEIQQNIIHQPGYRLEKINRFHLKLTAVRSGLGRYGKNNICYVDGMGSFLTLHAFLSDYPFEADHWQAMQMMELCQNCQVCLKQCPVGAIRVDNFVIDVSRCIPLYNEVEGVLPGWIPAGAHHALFGCMKCQAACPANREALREFGYFEDLSEEETRQFLSGNPDEAAVLAVSQKLKIPYLVGSREMIAVTSRNIQALVGGHK
jgi:epoxyqueuosine reductase